MKCTKKTKCEIHPVFAELVSAMERTDGQLLHFSVKYGLKKQINVINKKYGGNEPTGGLNEIGKHDYDGISYIAFTNSPKKPRVDTIVIDVDKSKLDAVMRRLIENDMMTVKIGNLYMSGKYNEFMQFIIAEEISRVGSNKGNKDFDLESSMIPELSY